jgi:hypothetical protein
MCFRRLVSFRHVVSPDLLLQMIAMTAMALMQIPIMSIVMFCRLAIEVIFRVNFYPLFTSQNCT